MEKNKTKETFEEKLGKWLHDYRMENGLTLREFSKKTGMKASQVSQFEWGKWDMWNERVMKAVIQAVIPAIGFICEDHNNETNTQSKSK